MIRYLVAALAEAEVEVDAEAIADALWLMRARRDEIEGGDREPASAMSSAPTEPRPPDAEPRHPVDSARAANVRARGGEHDIPASVSPASSGWDAGAKSITLRKARALPGALELGRALRPLKQRHPSKRDRVLDAEATVEYFCDTGVLTPVMRHGAERWFDVDVLVDSGPSMTVWQDTAAELVSLLERHGAFREVRHWVLEQIEGKVRLSRSDGVRSEAPQLVDSDARRLTMVVTDCVSPKWYQGPIWDAIRQWGLFSPVVIVMMLPSRLWPRTALGSAELTMRSHQPGAANRSLDIALPWWWPDDDPPQSSVPVPVITLEAAQVAAWARMLMGAGGVEAAGVFAAPPARPGPARSRGGPPDAEMRVRRFRVTVSPIAYRLAVYLSAALCGQWSLTLARIVQEAMLPDSSQVHLAEVIVGGLVRQAERHTGREEPMYEFVDDVVDVLQRSLTGTEALRVLQALGGYIERETGRSPGIAAMLLGETAPTDTAEEFGEVRAGAANLIRAMGLALTEVVPGPATQSVHLWEEVGRHSAAVSALAALPDGRLASGAQDGQLLIWDLARNASAAAGFRPGAELGRHGSAVSALAALPDGRLASGAQDGQLLIWDLARNASAAAGFRPGAELGRHGSAVSALAALPDGRLASGAQDGQLLIWDLARNASAAAGFRPGAELGRHGSAVSALAALPDGRLASGAQDGQLLIWDLARNASAAAGFRPGAELGRHGSAVSALAALPDGRLASGAQDGQLLIWDLARNASAAAGFRPGAELGRHGSAVSALAALPDGRLASGAQDGQLLIWDLARNASAAAGFRPGAELGRHGSAVSALAALPDGRLASGAQDGQLLIWDLAGVSSAAVPGQFSSQNQSSSEKLDRPPSGITLTAMVGDRQTPLSTSGRFIVDAHGKRVRLAGVNWYGASEDIGVPAGLDSVDRNTLAELIAKQGLNCVRFPFSLWMTEQTTPVADQYLLQNPDLYGSTPIEVYDACVKALTDQGLIVIPNCHLLDPGWCCSSDDTNGLWFNDRWPAAKFTAAWQDIARRYAANPLVAAMDIKNEPRHATVGGTTLRPAWGTAAEIDFAAMYTTVGNLIHHVNPNLLIICEGLNYAGDLTGVASHPVQLAQPDKVVYSLHDYSWSGHPNGQSQADYFEQMNKNGGYILTEEIAPLWVGEFGDTASALSSPGGRPWWANIQAWLTEYDVDWCWWALNPTHGQSSTPGTGQVQYYWGAPEPFGLLTRDWSDVGYPVVVTALQALMQPRSGPGVV